MLNERLAKQVRFEMLEKASFAELLPRVEYRLTEFRSKFTRSLGKVDRLRAELVK